MGIPVAVASTQAVLGPLVVTLHYVCPTRNMAALVFLECHCLQRHFQQQNALDPRNLSRYAVCEKALVHFPKANSNQVIHLLVLCAVIV